MISHTITVISGKLTLTLRGRFPSHTLTYSTPNLPEIGPLEFDEYYHKNFEQIKREWLEAKLKENL